MEEEEGYHDKHQLESSEQKKRHGKERQQTKPIHLSIAHTGEVEEEGYDDEYQLEDLEVAAADYMSPVMVPNFRKAWWVCFGEGVLGRVSHADSRAA